MGRSYDHFVRSNEEVREYIHTKLQEYNAKYMKEGEDFTFHIEENGDVIGGIVASSVGDTLEIEFLYVEEEYRGKSIGNMLLKHVEMLAQEKGIKRVLLNTYSFQAPEFYKKNGYTELLKIDPAFDGNSQYYFEKKLC